MSSDKTVTIDIKVIPNSSKSGFKIENDIIRLYLNSPPIEGRANDECVKHVSKKLHLPKSSVIIIRGEKNRNKTLQITGLSKDEIMKKLSS